MPFVRPARLAAFAAVFSLLAAPLHSQTAQTRLTRPINEGTRVSLSGTVHPLARASNDRGLAADSTPLERLQVVLKRSDAQESTLKHTLADIHDPESPNFHHWLTPDQFGQQFGPSDADVNTLETWLRSKGFNIVGLQPGRQVLEIQGTAATFNSTFHSEIHRYQVDGQTHFANASDPQIPEALAPVFGGFVSLNNFHVKHYSHVLGQASFDPATHEAKGNWTLTGNTATDLVLAPSDFAVQYDLNPLYTASPAINGIGQTIAIINESNINVYLANRFRTLFGLPANPPQVIIDGNDPGVDGINNPNGPNFASVEAYLDVEWAGAVAPQANIDLVIAADTNLQQGLYLAMEHAIYTNIAPVVSISFGDCEATVGTSTNQFLLALYEQAAAQGITVLVSSGDSGSAGCDDDNSQTYATKGLATNGYATTPYNIAVGGTDFYYSSYNQGSTAINTQLGNYWNLTLSNSAPTTSIRGVVPEQPWNDSQFGLNVRDYLSIVGTTNIIGGGGGPSTCASATTIGTTTTCVPYAKPSWQTAVGVPADGVRDTPDLSLFAANGLNYSFYPICSFDGDCQPVSSGGTVQITGVGGTSASAPAFAGMMAMINQKYGRQGQANYVLYPLAAQYPASFHDVTAGTNAVPCLLSSPVNCISTTVAGPSNEGVTGKGTTPLYNAGAGYDLATGLGSIDAAVMFNNWNKITFAASTTHLTPSSTSIAHGSNVTFSGTVTGSGTPTGNVELMTDSTEMAQQSQLYMPLSSGAFSSGNVNYLPGGTYNVWGQYSGDGANGASTSAKTQIMVTPESSGLFFIATTGTTIVPSGTTSIPYGTELSLVALPAPSTQLVAYQQCKTNSAFVCPSFTPPTGTITYADNGTTVNTAIVNSEGDAEYSSPFGVGAHSVTAAYSGDNSYSSSSTTSPQTFTVIKATPSLAVGATNMNSSGFVTGGQPTVLNFSVYNSSNLTSLVTPPTGTLTITGAPAGWIPTSGTLLPTFNSGDGTYSIFEMTVPATVTPGAYTLTIAYGGDSNYSANGGATTLHFLAGPSTLASTTTVTASRTSTIPTAPVILTVTVTGQSGHAAPTGNILVNSAYFQLASVPLPTVPSGISATVTIRLDSTALLQGTNQLTLQYSGDTTYQPSLATLTVTNMLADFILSPATTTIAVPASGIASDFISVSSDLGFAGSVNLTCTAPIGIICTPSPASVTVGSGGLATSTLNIDTSGVISAGNYSLVVTGTDSTGAYVHTLGLTANVSAATVVPGFGMTNSGAITLATPGASGTGAITITPTHGFTGSVALTCAVTGSPSGSSHAPTCSVASPASITSTTTATATLTINTTANAAVRGAPLERLFTVGGEAALAMLLFLGVPRRRAWRGLLVALFAVLLVVGISGCSSGTGSSSGGGSTPVNNGTTIGSYTVTVTGTSGSILTTTAVSLVVN